MWKPDEEAKDPPSGQYLYETDSKPNKFNNAINAFENKKLGSISDYNP